MALRLRGRSRSDSNATNPPPASPTPPPPTPPPPAPAPPRTRVWRSGGLALAVAILGGAVAVDRFVAAPTPTVSPGADAALVGAQVGSAATQSSSWFCAFGSSTEQGTADLTLELGNLSDRPQNATVAVVDDAGHRRDTTVRVGAHERVAVHVADTLVAEHVAAIVEGDGGLVVEHTVVTPHGASSAACATVASPTWHFADGATTKDARIQLALFNPFPEEAVVDATFATDRGIARPLTLQGIVVPPGQVRVVEVGDSVRRRTAVATEVNSRVGRVVAEELLQFDGSLGTRGSALVSGAPALSDVWFVARVVLGRGMSERLALHNPTSGPVNVEVQPLVPGVELDPIALTLAAHNQTIVNLEDDDRLPPNTGFSVAVTADRPALVVQHTVVAGAPARRRGVASALASPLGATRWVMAAGASSVRQQFVVAVFNPTDTATEVTLRAGDATHGPAAWERRPLAAGEQLLWRVGDALDAPAPLLEVTSSAAEVIVQRELTAAASVVGTVTDATGTGGRLPASARSALPLSWFDSQISPSTAPLPSGPLGSSGGSASSTSTTSTTSSTTSTPTKSTPTTSTTSGTSTTTSSASPSTTPGTSTTTSSTSSTSTTPGTSTTTSTSTSTTTSTASTTSTAPPTSTTPSVPVPRVAVPAIRRPALGISIGPAIPDVTGG